MDISSRSDFVQSSEKRETPQSCGFNTLLRYDTAKSLVGRRIRNASFQITVFNVDMEDVLETFPFKQRVARRIDGKDEVILGNILKLLLLNYWNT